ncbi:MAG: ArsR/SmtB family transcription factor [Bacillota bacterium]
MVRLLAEGRERGGLPPIQALQVPGSGDCDGICVYEFQEAFHLGQSKVSYHLRILREAGLVIEESRGKWSFYSINRRALQSLLETSHRYFLL